MAIYSVTETGVNRRAKVAQGRLREYTRTFDVISTIRNEDPITVRLAPGVPYPYVPYVNSVGLADLGSWCKEVLVQQERADPYLWRVEARYSSELARPDLNQIENPLLRPPVIRWGGTAVTRPAFEDRDGAAIVNAAEERYDPPVEEEDVRLTLSVQRNLPLVGFAPELILEHYGAVNSVPWLNFEAGSVRCFGLGGSVEFENGIYFWAVSGEFQMRYHEPASEAWAKRVLNQGYYEIVGGSRRLMRDPRTGQAITSPALLAADGTRLPVGDPPVFNTHHIYRQADFYVLGLV